MQANSTIGSRLSLLRLHLGEQVLRTSSLLELRCHGCSGKGVDLQGVEERYMGNKKFPTHTKTYHGDVHLREEIWIYVPL